MGKRSSNGTRCRGGQSMAEVPDGIIPAVAGAITGLIMFPASTWVKSAAGVFASTASAVYLGPMLTEFVAPGSVNFASGAGFLMGVGAMRLVPVFLNKVEDRIKNG